MLAHFINIELCKVKFYILPHLTGFLTLLTAYTLVSLSPAACRLAVSQPVAITALVAMSPGTILTLILTSAKNTCKNPKPIPMSSW